MKVLWTCLLALLLAGIGLLQVVAGKDCENNEYCNRKNGSCYWKDEESCNGSSFSYGCSEKGCACCVTDETACIEKNFCAKRNGTCIPKNESCSGEVLLDGCHTDGCHCCVENPVNITVECEPKDCPDYNGTCFERGKVPCNGTIYSRGCKDVFCACCVPDTSICIAKPACNGECKKTSEGCNGTVIENACHGTDCQCCVEDDDDDDDD
ncbi:uncharacterized protein LOC134778960 [Penaeus indicus]|uniref:uncharacterized protein LOC134778960 n=1 Tax=Penaeus indicus TaxID=29960 RepID=UPI00300D53CE